eukprot:SAG11_NODE_136_length_15118_cov_14.188495_13_plen_91_part_00
MIMLLWICQRLILLWRESPSCLPTIECYFGSKSVFSLNLVTAQYCTKFSITVEFPATGFTLVGVTLLFTYSKKLLWGQKCFSLNLVTAQC